MGSAILIKWVVPFFPAALNLRTPSVITGLAVPLIVLLAAIGLDYIWNLNWPALMVRLYGESSPLFNLRWLLVIPLFLSVRSAYQSATQYMALVDAPLQDYPILGGTGQAGAQWISSPYGETFLDLAGLQSGLKLTNTLRPWDWRDRAAPEPFAEFSRSLPAGADLPAQDGLYYVLHPGVSYASVSAPSGAQPCQATSLGGNIDVTCTASAAGQLVVTENNWSGWQVWRDGVKVSLLPGQWLSTAAPAGTHHYAFRYIPWDVILGFVLMVIGFVAAMWLLLKRRGRHAGLSVSRA
jgi:hypothetical protein